MHESRGISDLQETDFDFTIQRLVSVLKNNPVLMVGAGSSKVVGYPLWPDLINELNMLAPSLQRDGKENLLIYADRVKDQLDKEGRIEEYYDFLTKSFQPKSKHFDMFHRSLLNLDSAGIVTPNYDIVLELAARNSSSWCEPIDLCSSEEKYTVLKFLRSIPRTQKTNSQKTNLILHLHGCFKNPKKIVLTQKDYLRAYGEIKDEEKLKYGQALNTFHRKVIWSLLATHTVVFIGFSMSDEFFMKVLEMVKEDFEIDTQPMHFAIISDKDKERTSEILRSKGVFPLFYPHSEDHQSLQDLIFKVEHLTGKNSTSYGNIQPENNRELSNSIDLSQETSTNEKLDRENMNKPESTVSQFDSVNLDDINKKMLEL